MAMEYFTLPWICLLYTSSHLSAKRNIGEYVGNYVSYGYKKCDTDKSQIEIDPVAAKHVRAVSYTHLEMYYGLSQMAGMKIRFARKGMKLQ